MTADQRQIAARRRRRRLHHGPPAERVDGRHGDAQLPRRRHRARDRVGDVVPLEVEKHPVAAGDQLADQRRAFPGHQDRAHLDPLDLREPVEQSQRLDRRSEGRARARPQPSRRSSSRTIRSGKPGVGQGRRSDGDQRRADPQVLPNVLRGAHPSDPDDRHAPGALDDARRRQHADREQGRPAHAAVAVAQPVPAGLAVEQSGQRVDHGDAVGTRVPGDQRHAGDVGQHRRELGDEGQPGAEAAESRRSAARSRRWRRTRCRRPRCWDRRD